MSVATVAVVCRGTYTDKGTGGTIHQHDVEVCYSYRRTFFTGAGRQRTFSGPLATQWLDNGDTEQPDDFELLDQRPELFARGRLVITCPSAGCGRGLTLADAGRLERARAVLAKLADHNVPSVDIESLRGYSLT